MASQSVPVLVLRSKLYFDYGEDPMMGDLLLLRPSEHVSCVQAYVNELFLELPKKLPAIAGTGL